MSVKDIRFYVDNDEANENRVLSAARLSMHLERLVNSISGVAVRRLPDSTASLGEGGFICEDNRQIE
jgi:hypothetical protein